MDLGIQIPQKINLLSHVLLQTPSFSHVLRAELLLLDPGRCPQPMGGPSPASSQGTSTQPLHLRDLHSSGARPWERAQMRSQWEMHRKTPRRNSRQRQGPATKPGHIASTTLLRKIWPDNLKAFTNSPISLPQVKHTYRCLLDNKPELCSELCHSPVTHMASGEEQFNSITINECNFFCPFFLTSISWLCFPLLSLGVPAECWNSCPGCLLSQPLLGQLLCAHLDNKELCPTQQK